MNVDVRRTRANRADHLGKLSGIDALRRLGKDLGGADRAGYRGLLAYLPDTWV